MVELGYCKVQGSCGLVSSILVRVRFSPGSTLLYNVIVQKVGVLCTWSMKREICVGWIGRVDWESVVAGLVIARNMDVHLVYSSVAHAGLKLFVNACF